MSRFNRVRVNMLYRFEPVMIDALHPPVDCEPGQIVRVVNLPGCPRANTMGHCHVAHLGGQFAGLVCVNSLQVLTESERATVRHVTTATRHRRPSTRFIIEYGPGVERTRATYNTTDTTDKRTQAEISQGFTWPACIPSQSF